MGIAPSRDLDAQNPSHASKSATLTLNCVKMEGPGGPGERIFAVFDARIGHRRMRFELTLCPRAPCAEARICVQNALKRMGTRRKQAAFRL